MYMSIIIHTHGHYVSQKCVLNKVHTMHHKPLAGALFNSQKLQALHAQHVHAYPSIRQKKLNNEWYETEMIDGREF